MPIPSTTKSLPSVALRDAWAVHLRDIKFASSIETLSNNLYLSSGWVTGLVQAEVIDINTFESLFAERNAAEETAKMRLCAQPLIAF